MKKSLQRYTKKAKRKKSQIKEQPFSYISLISSIFIEATGFTDYKTYIQKYPAEFSK